MKMFMIEDYYLVCLRGFFVIGDVFEWEEISEGRERDITILLHFDNDF